MNLLFYALIIVLQSVNAPRGSIEGIVLNSGTVLQRVLPNARLELSEGPGTPIVARSDGGGRFVFPNLAPGRYRLFLTEDGYIRQEYGQRLPNQPGTPITVAGGQPVKDILFRLEAAPTITGWVLDEFAYPVPNILVQALKRTYDARGKAMLAVFASAVTDDRGQYRIFWVDPGEYYALAMSRASGDQATAASRISYAPTYFPGVTDPDSARPFRVDIGREVRADFRLRRQGLAIVNGSVFNNQTGQPMSAAITLTPVEDVNITQYRGDAAAGSFSIYGVVPGSYIVSAVSSGGNRRLSAFARVRVVSVPNYSISVRLPLSPGQQLNGRLGAESERTPDLRGAQIRLTAVDSGFPSPPPASALPDGQFSVVDVLPGEYLLSVSSLPDDMYVRAARHDTVDVLESGITIRNERSPVLQIALAPDGGRILVAAFDRDNRPIPTASVVLVPDIARRYRPDQYRVAIAGTDGQAVIRGIPPGNYKVFAWDNLEPNAYMNSEYVRRYEDLGVPVRIAPGENSAISVRAITQDQ